jgi:hypothetical protein
MGESPQEARAESRDHATARVGRRTRRRPTRAARR